MNAGGIITAALSFGFAAFALKLIADAQDARVDEVFGDVPRVPDEMAATRKPRGDEAATEQRPLTGNDTARHIGTAL